MRKPTALMIATVSGALVLAGLWLWPQGGPAALIRLLDEKSRAGHLELGPDSIHRERVETDPSESSTEKGGPPGQRYVPSAGRATLMGRVVDQDGEPREGATVAVAAAPYGWPHKPTILAEDRTGSNGMFRLRGLEPGESYMVRATQEGYAQAVSKGVEPRAGETVDLGDLTLESTCQVAGRVVDTAGNPIVGATVKPIFSQDGAEATTDAEGRFLLDGLPPGKMSVGSWAQGFVSGSLTRFLREVSQARLELHPGERRDGLLLVMKPEGVIRGRIVGTDGAPQLDEIFRISASANRSNMTGEVAHSFSDGGRFELSQLDPDQSYDLVATGLSDRTQIRVDVRCGEAEVVFELPHLPVIQVAIRSASDGSPLQADEIRLHRGSELIRSYNMWYWKGRPEAEPPELVLLPYSDAGRFELTITKNGFEEFEYGPVDLDGRSRHGPVMAMLQEEPTTVSRITGIVLRAGTREPLPGVRVMLERRAGGLRRGAERVHGVLVQGLSSYPGEPTTRTDAEGRFSFDHDREVTSASLRLNDAHYSSHRVFASRYSPTQDLELLAHEHGAVEGHVLQMDGGAGAGLPIVAHRPEAAPRTTRTNTRGEYRIRDLLPGTWSISVGNLYARERQGLGRWGEGQIVPSAQQVGVKVVIPEGRLSTADIDLRQLGAALRGTVKINGVPRISHKVLLRPANAKPRDRIESHEAWTGSSGGYGFLAVPPGKYRVTVHSHTGSAVLAEIMLSLPRGHTLRHDFEIQLGRIEVTLLEQENGAPLQKVQVSAVRIPPPEEKHPGKSRIVAFTDENGLAVLSDLTADEFSVVIRTGRGVLGRRIHLASGSTQRLTVRVPHPTPLRITVTNGDVLRSSHLRLLFQLEGQYLFFHLIASPFTSSTVTLQNVQPATYEVEASTNPRKWSARGTVEVLPGGENTLSLTLECVDPEEQDLR